MGVAKARLLQPLEYLSVPINKTALVVGGGLAGMTSALGLADQGFQVHLVERKKQLGGNARKLHTTWRGGLVSNRLEAVIGKVTKHPNISIHFNSIVEEAAGVVGNFTSTLSNREVIQHGIVVLAIGASPYRPEGEYLYNQNPNVLLSLDMDAEIVQGTGGSRRARVSPSFSASGPVSPSAPIATRCAAPIPWRMPSN